jgi:uncharacterized protein (DUF488 family)
MPPTLFTLGYEGLTIEAFITRLQTALVKTVVDVRELPLSRKKGFLKSAFCTALSAHGIAYLHMPALGCPKPIRNQYRTDGNWQTYTREFLKYIQTQEASLRELVKIAQATPACLVCFEYVAGAPRQLGGPAVMHLTAKTALPDLDYQQAA